MKKKKKSSVTSPGLDVDGDALGGPRVELHEDGGESRIDDERHQEEKGKEAEGAEEDEERGCVEEQLLQERLLVQLYLRLHCTGDASPPPAAASSSSTARVEEAGDLAFVCWILCFFLLGFFIVIDGLYMVREFFMLVFIVVAKILVNKTEACLQLKKEFIKIFAKSLIYVTDRSSRVLEKYDRLNRCISYIGQ